jgi:hypothetical protein
LSGGAIEHALAVGAELAGSALIAAFTAVLEVDLQVSANTGAIGKTRRTNALAADTLFATSAFRATSTAIIGVGVGIDTGARTLGLSGGAVEYALAIGAELTGGTFFIAAATMIEIELGIDACTGTIGEVGWA